MKKQPQPLKDEELFALATELQLVVFRDSVEELARRREEEREHRDRPAPKPFSQLT